MTTVSSQIRACSQKISISFHTSETPPGSSSKISKISESAHPSGPWTTPRDPGNYPVINPRFPGINTLQEQSLCISFQYSTTRQQQQNQHQLFTLQTFGHWEKSASASSFHHQAAAPNQHQLPVPTTRQQHHISQPPARHPANQLLTLLPCHTHIMAARSVVV